MFRFLKSLNPAIKLLGTPPSVFVARQVSETADLSHIAIPLYDINKPQSLEKRKARLHYQSRKRGMLENDLLLSTFAKKYLHNLTEEQTLMYDRLINSPHSDWDIFYWMVEKQPTPEEFDNEIMDMLKRHAKNEEKVILHQPDL